MEKVHIQLLSFLSYVKQNNSLGSLALIRKPVKEKEKLNSNLYQHIILADELLFRVSKEKHIITLFLDWLYTNLYHDKQIIIQNSPIVHICYETDWPSFNKVSERVLFVYLCVYIYLPIPLHRQDVTQSQFQSEV